MPFETPDAEQAVAVAVFTSTGVAARPRLEVPQSFCFAIGVFRAIWLLRQTVQAGIYGMASSAGATTKACLRGGSAAISGAATVSRRERATSQRGLGQASRAF